MRMVAHTKTAHTKHLHNIRMQHACICVHMVHPTQDPLLHRYTLLNTITAFGMAKRPDLAVVTFRAAAADGSWQPEHGDVANALLNALAGDVTAAHAMYGG